MSAQSDRLPYSYTILFNVHLNSHNWKLTVYYLSGMKISPQTSLEWKPVRLSIYNFVKRMKTKSDYDQISNRNITYNWNVIGDVLFEVVNESLETGCSR